MTEVGVSLKKLNMYMILIIKTIIPLVFFGYEMIVKTGR